LTEKHTSVFDGRNLKHVTVTCNLAPLLS